MSGTIPPLQQYIFMAWRLVKHRGKFTLPLVYLPHLEADSSISAPRKRHGVITGAHISNFPMKERSEF